MCVTGAAHSRCIVHKHEQPKSAADSLLHIASSLTVAVMLPLCSLATSTALELCAEMLCLRPAVFLLL